MMMAVLGVSVGIWLLTWLGLGFLAVEIGRGLVELGGRCLDAVRIAWDAHGQSDREARIDRAADGLAEAVALLLKPEERVASEVVAIDFTKPVDVVTVPKGTEFVQYQVPGRAQGAYYAAPGTTPSQLGISPQGQIRATGEIVNKVGSTYTVAEDVQMLRSTAKKVLDTWLVAGQSIQTQGGAIQWFSPDKAMFLKGG